MCKKGDLQRRVNKVLVDIESEQIGMVIGVGLYIFSCSVMALQKFCIRQHRHFEIVVVDMKKIGNFMRTGNEMLGYSESPYSKYQAVESIRLPRYFRRYLSPCFVEINISN